MSWLADHAFLVAFLAAYSLLLLWHGWEGRRGTRRLADYYVGGRAMGGFVIGLSFFATYSSTNSFVGFAGQAYLYGTPWLLIAPMVVAFSVIAWWVIAPRLRYFTGELGSLTLPDYIGFRFGSTPARVLSAIVVLFASLFYLTAIFKGIGNSIEVFLDVPYITAVLIVFLIVMTYTAVGGFISVVRTDVVQGLMMVAASLLLLRGTVAAAGGPASFFDVAALELPDGIDLFSWNAAMPFPVLLGILVAGTIKFIVEPRQLSRFYALRDDAAIRRGRWVSTLSFLLVYAAIAPIGIYARNIFPTGFTDSDRIVPALLTDPAIFHPVISAFMLMALIAAAMSSIDSVLLVMAATCHRDLVGLWRGEGSDRAALRSSAAYVALFALIVTIMAIRPPGSIVKLTSFSGSVYAACFFPTVMFGLYWRRGSGAAVITSMLIGFMTLLLWPALRLSVHEVFPAMLFSTLAYLAIAWLAPPYQERAVSRLFEARTEERRARASAGARAGNDDATHVGVTGSHRERSVTPHSSR